MHAHSTATKPLLSLALIGIVNEHPQSSMKNPLRKSSSKPNQSSQGRSIQSWWRRFFNNSPSTPPSLSTSLHPPTSSVENVGGETGSTSTPLDVHGASLAVPGLAPPTGSPAAQSKGPTTSIAPGQSHFPEGLANNPAEMPNDSLSVTANAGSVAMDYAKVTLRFTQTLLKKLSDAVDTNPLKIASGIAKIILQIKDDVEDNLDAVGRRIVSTAAQFAITENALMTWKLKSADEQWMHRFKKTLGEELARLYKLRDESIIRKIADHEDEKKQIAEIFERVNEARVQFELAIGIRVFKSVYAIEEVLRKSFLKDLTPSKIADHKYHLEGDERQLLRRVVCTPGTRVRILDAVITWAKDTSTNSPTIYWLFGPAGSGKSTIAYTIARRFEYSGDTNDTIILGGNFFGSRQFDETKQSKWIVRTIAYQLALRCKPFADALSQSGNFDTIHHNVLAQIQTLLVEPWQASEDARLVNPSSAQHYLVVIDALDEIDGSGGSEFLHGLLDVINKSQLSGLKFFATSRPDPQLVTRVGSFERKQFFRLQDVEKEQVHTDIVTYLNAILPKFSGRDEVERLATLAAGLFIYTATVVKYLEPHAPAEQKKLLQKLLPISDSVVQTLSDATVLLDALYRQILSDALGRFKGDILADRRHILHTYLCTAERTTAPTVANLLFAEDPDETDPELSSTGVANEVLRSLYAVLYVENDKVLSYHKSFTDFMFVENQSKEFWCDQTAHHRLLTESCFRIMATRLKFNIANISSSFILDRDNPTLSAQVKRNIPPVLSYSCRHWAYHISAIASTDSDPLHGTLSEFLQLHALFWIEAMNLLGSRGMCDPMLRSASEFVRKLDSVLATAFIEAAMFAVYFGSSPAYLSTPHLYISALATWPKNVNPCRGWRDSFPRIPAFTIIGQRGDNLLLMTLKLENEVWSVAFSRDDRQIVSGSLGGTLQVWDASTGQALKVLYGHTSTVNSVMFSSDGKQIVSGSSDKSVRVWDAYAGQALKVLHGPSGILSVAFSSDGKYIVSGSCDKLVMVWEASTGDILKVLNGHTDLVQSVAFSGDGRQIVSGSHDKSVRVWDVLTGVILKVLDGHTDQVLSVAFSSDGSRIVSGSWDTSVRVWDASTGGVLKVLEGHPDAVYTVAFSSDGSRIGSGSRDKSVRVWDASTGQVLKVLRGYPDSIYSVAFSSDGSRIISDSEDHTVRVWDASTSEVPKVRDGHTDSVWSVTFSRDGRQIISGSRDGAIRVWDASTGKILKALWGHARSVTSVALSSNGSQIVSGSGDKSVRVWNALAGQVLKILDGHTNEVWSVAFSSDDRHISSGSWDKTVRVWDASTGQALKVLDGHSSLVGSVAFSNDGKQIVSGSWDKSVRVWDVSTGEVLKVLEGHSISVHSVAFSSDSSRIVCGSYKSVWMWDMFAGEVLKVLEGHTQMVKSVAFSSDDSRIVSGSEDKSVWVWNALSGEVLKVLEGHTGTVGSVAFSSDDTRIISGSNDKSVRVWDLSKPSHYIREQISDRAGRLTYTGWLLSPSGEGYLMFIPLDVRLPDPSNILTMPSSAGSSLDLAYDNLGIRWCTCYRT